MESVEFHEDVDDNSDYTSDSNSSDFSESYATKQNQKSGSNSTKSKKSDRLPTRRPDPNVYNRNAIMARENRRKKKEYIEKLEKDIEKQRKINKKLHKMLKHQSVYVQSLQNEKNYFKSILANKTQILSLVNLVRTATIAQPEQGNPTFNKSSSSSPSSSPLQTCLVSDDNEYGIVNNIDSFSSSILHNSDIFFTDYNVPLSDCTNWDELLQIPDTHYNLPLSEISFIQETQTNCSTINDEHSYFSTTSISDKESDDSGVCLHISGGKFSLEFCAACHEKSKKPIINEF